jgi:TRAP-type C4-dicarboxylate transport system substrate-binding protein
MFGTLIRSIAIMMAMIVPAAASADPIKLKFAFFTSDRASIYLAGIKPFVDAVNAEGEGLLQIELYFSGALGRNQVEQAQMVDDGVADIAFVTPGLLPERFPDNAIVEFSGLYRDIREASLVYTQLTAANALKGYENFQVISAYVAEPQNINVRRPIASLNDLKGMKIRANSAIQGAALEKLGMVPVLMPLNQVAEAISSGQIDGAPTTPSILFEFGISRFTTYHYALGLNGSPLAVLMNRKKFESLPAKAQAIIRKYSGEWSVARFFEIFPTVNSEALDRLKSDPARKLIVPTKPEQVRMQSAFDAVIEGWAEKSARNRGILNLARSEIAKLRG